jgi:hypothetical protein
VHARQEEKQKRMNRGRISTCQKGARIEESVLARIAMRGMTRLTPAVYIRAATPVRNSEERVNIELMGLEKRALVICTWYQISQSE